MSTDKKDRILNAPDKGLFPKLRFSEFADEWTVKRLGDDCEIQMCKRIFANQTSEMGDVPFYKIGTIGGSADAFITKELFSEYKAKYNFPRKGEVLITCAGTVGKTVIYDGEDAYYQDSNIVWISNPKQYYTNAFLQRVLSRIDWSKLNTTTIVRIYNDNLRDLRILYPSKREQDKISSLLGLIDERIVTQSRAIEDLKRLRTSLRTRIFRKVFSEYECIMQIKDVLSYEQPTKYLVSNTEFSDDKSLTPVLTANKAFILGYTDEKYGVYKKGNCIILDDFTLDCKIVKFPFKVKSSAIKILTSKKDVSLRYVFEYLKFLDLETTEHKRHYIAEIEPMEIVMPSVTMIQSIANLFELLDNQITNEENIFRLYVFQKQYLLQSMFI